MPEKAIYVCMSCRVREKERKRERKRERDKEGGSRLQMPERECRDRERGREREGGVVSLADGRDGDAHVRQEQAGACLEV